MSRSLAGHPLWWLRVHGPALPQTSGAAPWQLSWLGWPRTGGRCCGRGVLADCGRDAGLAGAVGVASSARPLPGEEGGAGSATGQGGSRGTVREGQAGRPSASRCGDPGVGAGPRHCVGGFSGNTPSSSAACEGTPLGSCSTVGLGCCPRPPSCGQASTCPPDPQPGPF